MSEKRRGLGRGLGALIPTGLDGQRPTGAERPVDVFFPDPKRERRRADGTRSRRATATLTRGTRRRRRLDRHRRPSGARAARRRRTATPADGGDGDATEVAAPARPVAEPRRRRSVADDDGLVPVPGARFAELPVASIRPNPRQPRTVFDEDALEELVGSIREIGVLQPIVVRDAGDGYELIMGERRWRATQAAGLATIPAIIRDTEDADLLRDALLENLHRVAAQPARGGRRVPAAARRLRVHARGAGDAHPAVAPADLEHAAPAQAAAAGAAPGRGRGAVRRARPRAARAAATLPRMERLAQRIVAEGLSVRAVEEIVSLGGDAEPTARRAAPRRRCERNEALDHLAARLSDRFETRVKVSLGKSRGRLTVEFASVQDLNRILASLAPEDPGLLKG